MGTIDERTDEQYEVLLSMFQRLIDGINGGTLDLIMLQDIIDRRSFFMFGYCADSFGLDIYEAIDIVKERNEGVLNPYEKERRKCLIAAMDNLIDFAIAAETQMYMDMENGEDDDPESTFLLYNKTYAKVENNDIGFAAGIASSFISMPEHSTLMFMTQGDDRVRDSHRALEGLSFPKYAFPEWLIPPIDWRCRCYLVESYESPTFTHFERYEDKIENAVNPVFRESLATGGRIFGADHPYFTIDISLKNQVYDLSSNIKGKYNLS